MKKDKSEVRDGKENLPSCVHLIRMEIVVEFFISKNSIDWIT